ncbi:hypothetical protein BS47DRAFT_1366592 [Hydnum rufescens UP504]|uniref:Uncharacterized protein n=1 Tax=Hydnum rufescens UP504 TaxID=1448309 RepID=A0A9P6DRF6_9AGAM|nr:hypothetical protein BS47DRAFT_1366592 [Hydnum rufescens UP504]
MTPETLDGTTHPLWRVCGSIQGYCLNYLLNRSCKYDLPRNGNAQHKTTGTRMSHTPTLVVQNKYHTPTKVGSKLILPKQQPTPMATSNLCPMVKHQAMPPVPHTHLSGWYHTPAQVVPHTHYGRWYHTPARVPLSALEVVPNWKHQKVGANDLAEGTTNTDEDTVMHDKSTLLLVPTPIAKPSIGSATLSAGTQDARSLHLTPHAQIVQGRHVLAKCWFWLGC